MTDTADDLIGRLQRDISDADRESYMIEWDGIRRQVLDDMGDLPRLKFESILEAKDELLRQAADRISADQARIQVLEAALTQIATDLPERYVDGAFEYYSAAYTRVKRVARQALSAAMK